MRGAFFRSRFSSLLAPARLLVEPLYGEGNDVFHEDLSQAGTGTGPDRTGHTTVLRNFAIARHHAADGTNIGRATDDALRHPDTILQLIR